MHKDEREEQHGRPKGALPPHVARLLVPYWERRRAEIEERLVADEDGPEMQAWMAAEWERVDGILARLDAA